MRREDAFFFFSVQLLDPQVLWGHYSALCVVVTSVLCVCQEKAIIFQGQASPFSS